MPTPQERAKAQYEGAAEWRRCVADPERIPVNPYDAWTQLFWDWTNGLQGAARKGNNFAQFAAAVAKGRA